MSAQEASMWWAKHWERPASLENARNKHSQFIPSYEGFQSGGAVNMRGSGSQMNRTLISESQKKFAQEIAKSSSPIVVSVPSGGGESAERDSGQGPSTNFPILRAEDSSIVSMEYKYRITMGASV